MKNNFSKQLTHLSASLALVMAGFLGAAPVAEAASSNKAPVAKNARAAKPAARSTHLSKAARAAQAKSTVKASGRTSVKSKAGKTAVALGAAAAVEAAAKPTSASLTARWVSKLIQFLLKSTNSEPDPYLRNAWNGPSKCLT